jgi:hypothetical protein
MIPVAREISRLCDIEKLPDRQMLIAPFEKSRKNGLFHFNSKTPAPNLLMMQEIEISIGNFLA